LCRWKGKPVMVAAGGALRQHSSMTGRVCRGSPGKILFQKRRGFCMTPTRKKQRTNFPHCVEQGSS